MTVCERNLGHTLFVSAIDLLLPHLLRGRGLFSRRQGAERLETLIFEVCPEAFVTFANFDDLVIPV
jgi:hypothetical protein